MGTGIVEVEVIKRWRGSAVNPGETCGISEALAVELLEIDPPAIKVLRYNVQPTAGVGKDGIIGSDTSVNQTDALITLVGELVTELRQNRESRRK